MPLSSLANGFKGLLFLHARSQMNSAAQKELATVAYWDKRYSDERSGVGDKNGEDYEWFKTYEKLKPFFSKHLPPAESSPRILQLGCGTSVGPSMIQVGHN